MNLIICGSLLENEDLTKEREGEMVFHHVYSVCTR